MRLRNKSSKMTSQQAASCCLLMVVAVLVLLICDSSSALKLVEKNPNSDGCGLKDGSPKLLDFIQPLDYQLQLDIEYEQPKFGGIVKTILLIKERTNEIRLNADESLDIEEITYEDHGKLASNGADGPSRSIRVKSACLNTVNQVLVITLEEFLEPETAGYLNLVYLAPFSDKRDGLYKRTYFTSSGKRERVILSELNPRTELSLARKMFPCFDEPQMKAAIRLEVACKQGVTVRGNSDLSGEQTIENGRKIVKFKLIDPIEPKQLYLTLTNN